MKDQKKTKRNNSRLFSGTYEYYVNYRPGIPKKVIEVIIKHFDIEPTDRVLDLGCGTGQVALAMDGRCGEMICVDPDPEMIEWAKRATRNSKIRLIWVSRRAEDLGKIKKKLGLFKVATSCRAFHRMDQDQVLRNLDELIEENGGVAVFSDWVLWKGNQEWQQVLKKVIQKYLGEKKDVEKEKLKESEERWETILTRSVFRFIKTQDIPIVRSWNVESIIGYLFSTSFATPHLFGNRLDRFKEEVKSTLLSLNPKGKFQENAVWSIVLGSRKPFR